MSTKHISDANRAIENARAARSAAKAVRESAARAISSVKVNATRPTTFGQLAGRVAAAKVTAGSKSASKAGGSH